MVDKWDARVLSVHPVAGHTIMREGLLAIGPSLWGIGQRVLLALIADKKVMLGVSNGLCLQFSWRIRFTPCQSDEASGGDSNKENAHCYSTTCNFKVIEP